MTSLIPRGSVFDIDRLMNNFWTPFGKDLEMEAGTLSPRVDIKDNKDHYEITAELPGVKREDLDITLENGVLTISAETHREDKEEKEGKVIRQERFYGKYVRSFSVGDDVSDRDIEAGFKDGVLTLKAKKGKPETKPAHRITVN